MDYSGHKVIHQASNAVLNQFLRTPVVFSISNKIVQFVARKLPFQVEAILFFLNILK